MQRVSQSIEEVLSKLTIYEMTEPDKLAEQSSQNLDWRRSIVDMMKLLKLDSSLAAHRSQLVVDGPELQLDAQTTGEWWQPTKSKVPPIIDLNVPRDQVVAFALSRTNWIVVKAVDGFLAAALSG